MNSINKKFLIKFALIVVIIGLPYDYAGGKDLSNFHITVSNTGTKQIVNTFIKFDKSMLHTGYVAAGGSATYLYFEKPISLEAKVVCTMENEDTFERTVSMNEIKNFSKEKEVSIIFSIDTDKKEASVKFYKGVTAK